MPHRSHPSPHSHHVAAWQRWLLYATVAALLLTGAPWLVLHYTVGAGAGELPHPAEAWLMRLHGLASFVALFILGVMAGVHVPRGWRMSGRPRWARQRALGLIISTAAALLALSAYAMEYLVPEQWHDAVGWSHAAVGAVLALALPLHALRRLR